MALLSLSMSEIPHVLGLLCTAFILYHLAVSIYRVFFHPLAKYPGPLSYKLSEWPLVCQAYKGNRHLHLLRDHEKYGPILRIAPNTLSFNSASALSTIYNSRQTPVCKGEFYKTFDIATGTYSSFTETDKEKHAAKRRWMGPAFTESSLRACEPAILKTIEGLCETVAPKEREKGEKGWGKTKWNWADMSAYIGLDVMGGVVFGVDFGSVKGGEWREMATSITPANRFLYWISTVPVVYIIRPLMRTRLLEILIGSSIEYNNRLIDYANAQVDARLANLKNGENEKKEDGAREDFAAILTKGKDKKTGWVPTRADLDAESFNMLNAGQDPVSSALAGIMFYLIHNQDKLEILKKEIRTTFSDPSEIRNGPKLASCHYLAACIEESLRRASPLPSHVPREVMPGGITIDGEYLPAGTLVGSAQYVMHHNPAYFPDPWRFIPERWLSRSGEDGATPTANRQAFFPFSIGSRSCIGRHIAYLEIKLVFAHLIWRFDMKPAEGEEGRIGCGGPGKGMGRERVDEYQLIDALGIEREGPWVSFREKEDLKLEDRNEAGMI